MKISANSLFPLKNGGQTVDMRNEERMIARAENKELKEACQDFEALILNKMLSTMRESVPDDGLFPKSYGEKVYQSMLDEEISKSIAHGRGIGFADLLYSQLSGRTDASAHGTQTDEQTNK